MSIFLRGDEEARVENRVLDRWGAALHRADACYVVALCTRFLLAEDPQTDAAYNTQQSH